MGLLRAEPATGSGGGGAAALHPSDKHKHAPDLCLLLNKQPGGAKDHTVVTTGSWYQPAVANGLGLWLQSASTALLTTTSSCASK